MSSSKKKNYATLKCFFFISTCEKILYLSFLLLTSHLIAPKSESIVPRYDIKSFEK